MGPRKARTSFCITSCVIGKRVSWAVCTNRDEEIQALGNDGRQRVTETSSL